MASIKWLASAFEKYWMPKLSTQSVKVVLREVCLQSPGVWGMGLCEGGGLLGCLVDKYKGAWWGKRSLFEVEVTEGSCIC